MQSGAFLGRILFYTPGTAEPSEYSPAELVVYVSELARFIVALVSQCQWFAVQATGLKVLDIFANIHAGGIFNQQAVLGSGTQCIAH